MKFSFTQNWLKKASKLEEDSDFSGAGVATSGESQESTTYKIPYTKILDVQPHPNADRLSVATIYGFQVVVSKDRYKIGDYCIYIPIDSILPENLENILFPADSKIKLNNHRLRQIKIRGLVSQGMLINPEEIKSIVNPDYFKDEQDLGAILGITKYEPPVREIRVNTNGIRGRKKEANVNFHKYNGLQNIKWFPTMFKEGDEVVIQCKLHGTASRLGLLPYVANTWWKRFKKMIGLAPAFEHCYGSNNVDISAASNYKGFYNDDIYGKCFKSINAFDKVKQNETIFGEIVGPGIQKGYSYGLKEHHFVLFDVKRLQPDGTQVWLTPDEVEAYAKERGFEMVPILYKGPYNKELAYQLTFGPSEYNDKSEKVREGIVIKAAKDYSVEGNKQALKWVSETYLSDASNTDEH